jgi:hypothetical protein
MKQGKKRKILIIFCIMLLTTTTANATGYTSLTRTPHEENTNNISVTQDLISFWIGIISNMNHQGGWTPTIHFHTISVIVLINQYPWFIWLRNTDEIVAEYWYHGWIGPRFICAFVT